MSNPNEDIRTRESDPQGEVAKPEVGFVTDASIKPPDGYPPTFRVPPGIRGTLEYARFEASINPVPMPSPDTMERLTALYPDAPRVIFGEMQLQAVHRRDLERSVVDTKNKLAIRGQIIGGMLGATGLIGSLIVAGLGNGLAGFGIATSSLLGLVSVFVLGQNSQKQQLAANAAVRDKMDRGESVEKVERDKASSRKPESKPRGDRGKKGQEKQN